MVASSASNPSAATAIALKQVTEGTDEKLVRSERIAARFENAVQRGKAASQIGIGKELLVKCGTAPTPTAGTTSIAGCVRYIGR